LYPLYTHKYQGRVQVFVALLHEFFVVFFGLLVVVFVEFSTKILLVPSRLVSRAVGGILEWIRREVVVDGTHSWLAAAHPALHLRSPLLL